jgi:hypothetical protein
MTVKPAGWASAMYVEITRGHDANQRVRFWQTTEECGDEPECRCCFSFGHNFMQPAAGEAALGQVGIEGGKTEWQGSGEPL